MHLVSGDGLRVNIANLEHRSAPFRVRVLNASGNEVAMEDLMVAPGAIGTVSWPSAMTTDLRVTIRGPQGVSYLPTAELFHIGIGKSFTTAYVNEQATPLV
jgi:hypothetical protein